ncbi:MAG: M48 family metalloprotease [Candidatus Hermodarchaeota archaeon]
MKKIIRYFLLITYLFCSIGLFFILNTLIFDFKLATLLIDWTFLISLLLYCLTIEEFYHWVKNGKRSEMSDIVAITFFFFLIFFFSKDFLTSIMGSFSIYLWIGIFELKDYPVLNKILIISLITYNVIFIAGLFSFYLEDPFFINTSFAFSFWIILLLGFMLFGRKYIIIWRFMSPEYLTLFLYIIAWLAVVFINQYTPFTFIVDKNFGSPGYSILDFFMNIYFILIIVNWITYFLSGFILDKLLGIKRVKDENLLNITYKIKSDIGIKSKVKLGFGKYPILNAMAYGSFFDKRIAVIAEDIDTIPEDELKGIIAHELAHTKGRHTLILTLITSADLFIRMLFGIPATFYDYTFGNPRIPMISFILLNIIIYIFLFIFVRVLEGRADLIVKKVGYANELAKALYNLESFYASGREIGLNTMLLCDEKITKDNQLLDYISTAFYLNHSMIKPSKASLLANLINSHPPSYYRIAAILGNELKPSKEAILPFICLKKSKQKKYAGKFKDAREKFKIIANQKFKELFNVNDISFLMNQLKRKDLYQFDIQKTFLFKNLITNEVINGKLKDVQFIDDITDPDQLIVINLKNSHIHYLNSSLYSRVQYDLNEQYFLNKKIPLILKEIYLDDNNKKGYYYFKDKNNNDIKKPIIKTKLPNSLSVIKNFKEHEIFFKIKGNLKILTCKKIIPANNLKDFKLELVDNEKDDERIIIYSLNELIIRPKKIYVAISKSDIFRESEINVINWLSKRYLKSFIYLKKPVNNLEIGYIQGIDFISQEFKKKSINQMNINEYFISVHNIFGRKIRIPYNKLELISFEYYGAMIQLKASTSFSSRLGYKILKRSKPDRVIIT